MYRKATWCKFILCFAAFKKGLVNYSLHLVEDNNFSLFIFFLVAHSVGAEDKEKQFDLAMAKFKSEQEKILKEMKNAAVKYCKMDVSIACKMKSGSQTPPEEMYDAQELKAGKEMEAKVAICDKDFVCTTKALDEFTTSLLKSFSDKCSMGDKKGCFNKEIIRLTKKGTEQTKIINEKLEKLRK